MSTLKTGLLWFDGDPKKSTLQKVEEAVAFYRKKMQADPTVCYLHPSDIDKTAPGMVKPWRSVLKNHIWIGCEL
jgi:hypothetical protein